MTLEILDELKELAKQYLDCCIEQDALNMRVAAIKEKIFDKLKDEEVLKTINLTYAKVVPVVTKTIKWDDTKLTPDDITTIMEVDGTADLEIKIKKTDGEDPEVMRILKKINYDETLTKSLRIQRTNPNK